ncbi:MAG: hypothetical protein BWY44_00862 [Candidatus Omnitrophica bacterium ADurb.Bin292]|nr:MAG: hypothetical protein BWY44_00862 [Candidatus Omnitrophica bacterium ADurb.Bin292]
MRNNIILIRGNINSIFFNSENQSHPRKVRIQNRDIIRVSPACRKPGVGQKRVKKNPVQYSCITIQCLDNNFLPGIRYTNLKSAGSIFQSVDILLRIKRIGHFSSHTSHIKPRSRFFEFLPPHCLHARLLPTAEPRYCFLEKSNRLIYFS